MKVTIKNADFSGNSVTKVSEPIASDVINSYVKADGEVGESQNWSRTKCFEISQDMRDNGISLVNVKSNSTYPAIVFYNSSTPSAGTMVGVIHCSGYTDKLVYIFAEQIPVNATHAIVNCYPANSFAGVVNCGTTIDVADYNFADGYITETGWYNPSDLYQTSGLLPVKPSVNYFLRAGHVSKYDKDGNFIERTVVEIPDTALGVTTFAANVAFIRIGGLKTLLPFFLKI